MYFRIGYDEAGLVNPLYTDWPVQILVQTNLKFSTVFEKMSENRRSQGMIFFTHAVYKLNICDIFQTWW